MGGLQAKNYGESASVESRVAGILAERKLLQGVYRLGIGLSGGADSLALLHVLHQLNTKGEIGTVSLVPIFVDQYLIPSKSGILREYVADNYGLPLTIVTRDTRKEANALIGEGRAPCRACAPIRAGQFALAARANDLQAIALGHHLDDALATLLMNIFHRGKAETFRPSTVRRGPPRYRVVRPLYFCTETSVKACSPAGPSGLFSCGMCDALSSEREFAKRFVGQMLSRHSPSAHFAETCLQRLDVETRDE